MRFSRIIIFLLIAGTVAGIGYWRHIHPDVISVTVTYVEKGDVEATVANTRAGTIKACRRAKMSPSLGGQISELPFPEGAAVKRNDILLQLWNEDLRAEVVHAESALRAAEDNSQAICLQAANARRTADRSYKLYQSEHVSRQEYDRVKSEADARHAECKAARANMEVAKAALQIAQSRLQRTILYAPFDGVIANINGELNEYVTPSPPGIQTPPVIDLIEPDCFYLSAPIDEVDAPRVKPGMAARITLDAWRGRIFPGEVTRIGSYVIDREKQARTVEVELKFTNPEDIKSLLVGYSADVDIIIKTHSNVLRIPSEAMLDEEHVLVFNPDNQTLEERSITKGIANWNYTEVISGLAEGEALVTSLGDEGVEAGAVAEITDRNSDD
ncbi:MAG TPA: efflux RND transporter periplasmic adaptor subunit [Chromatiales bacterium]|nr:efflux RND transporter periplasmic adaptor subunit [Thiotrichales bacterium]HIP67467.1 efflux RND transporter periplasmic adaptor subunit [Chromatiales bacterium]